MLEGSPFYRGSWMILIDAAKGCATELPDLSKYKADFVAISFYKIFGYPIGLGALIVRNDNELGFCPLHDREWILKSPSGEILTQKKVPDMCYISAFIDLNLGILFVQPPQ